MKHTFYTLCLLFCSYVGNAQKPGNQFQVAAEAGIPTGSFGDAVKTGWGGSASFLLGIKPKLQAVFTSGYTVYKSKIELNTPSSSTHFKSIPVLAGVRYLLGDFYLQPQAGISINTITAKAGGASASDTQTSFTWNTGIGYVFNNFDFGVRYQHSGLKDNDSDIIFVGIHLGYNFSLDGNGN